MFAPAYLVTPSVAYPLPTANYPQHYVRAAAAWESLDHRNLHWLERIGTVVTECPIWRLARVSLSKFRVFYETPDGYRYNRVIKANKYLFIRQAAIVQMQTLLMLMLALTVTRLLPGPTALPMLPPPRVSGLLPARAESACIERGMPTRHIVWVSAQKQQEDAPEPLHAANRATVSAFLKTLDPTSEFDRQLAQQFRDTLDLGRANFTPRPLFE